MERFKIISAVHLFLIKDNKVLLLRRFNTGWQDGNYSVPAGHLDGNETVTSAMLREAKEETGIAPQNLKVIHVMDRKTERESIDFFFVASKWQGDIVIGEPEKCDDLSWFSLNNLPSNTIPYIRLALENYQKNIFYSEFGW